MGNKTSAHHTLTISISALGGVKKAINASGIAYENIKSLIIDEGILNANDCQFISQSLNHLATLEVGGSADFIDSTLPAHLFKDNTVLESVKSLNTSTIGEGAFEECSSLQTAEFPNTTTLDGRVFFNCYALRELKLPMLVSMENRAVYRCMSLTSLVLGIQPPELIGSHWFKEILATTVYVPTKQSIEKYKQVAEFSEFNIRLIGEESEDVNHQPYYDKKYDANLTCDDAGPYYTGDIKVGLNFFTFGQNIKAALENNVDGAAPLDTFEVIRFAKEAGFDAIDVTAYYIPGYSGNAMPTKPHEEIVAYARQIKTLAKQFELEVCGTGVGNDFADPSEEKRALDIKRIKYWIDIAAEMGAPVIRVFSGTTPRDIVTLGWEAIARDRISPALRECAIYGATKGVAIGLQNHGDMLSTAGQTIQVIKWVDHPNIGVINDTGYFREFRSSGLNYDWYKDIKAVLPYTNNFQLKKMTAGVETHTPIDLNKFFTIVRNSSYRGVVPIELLWRVGSDGHPSTLTEPPYEDVKQFLAQVKEAIEYTKKTGPSL